MFYLLLTDLTFLCYANLINDNNAKHQHGRFCNNQFLFYCFFFFMIRHPGSQLGSNFQINERRCIENLRFFLFLYNFYYKFFFLTFFYMRMYTIIYTIFNFVQRVILCKGVRYRNMYILKYHFFKSTIISIGPNPMYY